ncbi:MAG: GH36-type glycosyl hydrolase domain-containing protein [Candidatus Helarchaeota archaeon]
MELKSKDIEYGSGDFGKWIIDEFDLPAYEYKCMQSLDPMARTLTSGKDSTDHWHQVGNDRITLTAHNGGYMQYFIADRGLEWLSYHDLENDSLGGAICFIEQDNKIWSDLYNSKLKSGENYKRIFGCGYYQKIIKKNVIEIEHFIYPPFGDDPVVLSEIVIKNNSNEAIDIKVYEFWGIRIRYLIGSILSMLYMPKDRVKFGESKLVSFILRLVKNLLLFLQISSEQVRSRFGKKFSFNSHISESNKCLILTPKYNSKIPVKKEDRADRNYFHDPIFLKSFENDLPILFFNRFQIQKSNSHFIINRGYDLKTKSKPCLMIGHEIKLKAQESKTIKFIFGTAKKEKIPVLIKKYENLVDKDFKNENFKLWKKNSLIFSPISYKWLKREAVWHSYYLRSASLFDNYYNNHYLPQGNAYGFLHGVNGAVRDHVLFLLPMIYLNPTLARQILEFILRTMSIDGKLPYATMGIGQNMGAFVHKTSSDLHFFLLWSLLEYIYTTRDFEFLDKKIPFYPLDIKKSSTVLERIIISLKFIFNNIGIGEHGLIKIGSGDWSDGISLFVKNRGAFLKNGESTFNSALALYIFPQLIDLLQDMHPKIADFLRKKYIGIKNAVINTWDGKWCYRGYDGTGKPIGDKNLFLEHHVWIILANLLTNKQEKILIKNIYNLLDKKSKIGQFILYPPANVLLNVLPRGWDVNGGIWHAMNFLLTWVYGKVDLNKAFQSLIKNSLAKRAEIYPNIWYGIWSGPDSYNAEYASNPGHTFIHPATPQTDFPIMNLNLHTNFLNSIIKLTGISCTKEGITIDPKLPLDEFNFKTKIFGLKVSKSKVSGFYSPIKEDICVIKIRKPKEWNENITIEINNQQITENFVVDENWIKIKLKIPETGVIFSVRTQSN